MSKASQSKSFRRQDDDHDSLGGSIPYEALPQTSSSTSSQQSPPNTSVPRSRSLQAGAFHSLNAAASKVQSPRHPADVEGSRSSGKVPGFRPSGVAVPSPTDPQPEIPKVPTRSGSAPLSRQVGTMRLNRAAAASRLSLIPDDPVAEIVEAQQTEALKNSPSPLSREDMSRTLPRDFNLQTMSKDSQRRGALPSGFKPSQEGLEKPLPNPHGQSPSSIGGNDVTWEMVPRSNPSPSVGSPAREIPPTPPLDLPAARFGQGQSSSTGTPRTYGPSSSNIVSFRSCVSASVS